MGAAAKKGDMITGSDTHLIQPPGTAKPVDTPGHNYSGQIDGGLCESVLIMGAPAATVGSTATNSPSHVPSGGPFVNEPSNSATIITGSATVKIGGKAAARAGDTANTCNDPADLPNGAVQAGGSVMIG
jgi:uncharacterized Zn-binding protein involved in type VI secretion